jgi:hypothetical protein
MRTRNQSQDDLDHMIDGFPQVGVRDDGRSFLQLADCVAKLFCRLYRATLIRRRVPQRNFDSLHPRF